MNTASIDATATFHYLNSLTSLGLCPNTLLVCPEGLGKSFAQMALSVTADPVWYCPIPGELMLPQTSGGTLLVNDVARLRPDQQVRLLDWSERDEARIISVTERSLYPLVVAGDFLEPLYYRLNILRIDVADL